MASSKSSRTARPVWRISHEAPLGQWVNDAATGLAPVADAQELSTTGWAMSTFELQQGADVSEFGDTVPSELCEWIAAASKARP